MSQICGETWRNGAGRQKHVHKNEARKLMKNTDKLHRCILKSILQTCKIVDICHSWITGSAWAYCLWGWNYEQEVWWIYLYITSTD